MMFAAILNELTRAPQSKVLSHYNFKVEVKGKMMLKYNKRTENIRVTMMDGCKILNITSEDIMEVLIMDESVQIIAVSYANMDVAYEKVTLVFAPSYNDDSSGVEIAHDFVKKLVHDIPHLPTTEIINVYK